MRSKVAGAAAPIVSGALMIVLASGAAMAARVVDREGNYYLCDKGQYAYFVYDKDTVDWGGDYALRVFEVTKDKHKTGWVIWDCGFAESYEDALSLGEQLKERAKRGVEHENREILKAAAMEQAAMGLRTRGTGSTLNGKPVVATMNMHQYLAMGGPSLPAVITNVVDIRDDSTAYWFTGTKLVAEQGSGDYFELRMATPDDIAALLPRIRDTTGGVLAACGTLTITELAPGAAAEAAGMQPGDLLVEYDGVRVYTSVQLSDQRDRFTGDSVSVVLVRNDSIIRTRIPAGRIGVQLKENLPEFGSD
jgi:hypothetical protein